MADELLGLHYQVTLFMNTFSLVRAVARVPSDTVTGGAPTAGGGRQGGGHQAPPSQGLVLSSGWQHHMARFITAPESACGRCLTTKHGLFNCPRLWLDLGEAAERGQLGVTFPEGIMAKFKAFGVSKCAEKYPALEHGWQAIVAEGTNIVSQVVVQSRLSHLGNLLSGQQPLSGGGGRGRGRGRGRGTNSYFNMPSPAAQWPSPEGQDGLDAGGTHDGGWG
jgi:hypothetical protein